MSESFVLGPDKIMQFLPHRYPFLLVDRVLEIIPTSKPNDMNWDASKVGTRVRAIKNITINEPFFQGHFPGQPIAPGVLLVEMMAQVGSFAVFPYVEEHLKRYPRDFGCVLVGIDGARFRRPVTPGDTLLIEAEVSKCRGRLWGFKCSISTEGKVVAEAEVLANLVLTGAGKGTPAESGQ